MHLIFNITFIYNNYAITYHHGLNTSLIQESNV